MGRSYLTVRALVVTVTCLVCLEYFSLLQVEFKTSSRCNTLLLVDQSETDHIQSTLSTFTTSVFLQLVHLAPPRACHLTHHVCTVSKRVLILRTWSLIRTFLAFWVLNGSLLRIQFKLNTALLSYCPCVCSCVTGVTSYISHIYKGTNAKLIIRGPIKPYIF